MTNERSVGTIWSEETENGIVLHKRVGTGADVMLTLPNAEVAAQAEGSISNALNNLKKADDSDPKERATYCLNKQPTTERDSISRIAQSWKDAALR